MEVDGVWESTGVFLQMLLASLIIYKLTKSISNIVQGLMSGSPSLGGSMMTEQTKAAAGTALAATGNVVGARSAAGGVIKKGFLANIGKGAVKSTDAYQHYSRGRYRLLETSSTQSAQKTEKEVTIFKANKDK